MLEGCYYSPQGEWSYELCPGTCGRFRLIRISFSIELWNHESQHHMINYESEKVRVQGWERETCWRPATTARRAGGALSCAPGATCVSFTWKRAAQRRTQWLAWAPSTSRCWLPVFNMPLQEVGASTAVQAWFQGHRWSPMQSQGPMGINADV